MLRRMLRGLLEVRMVSHSTPTRYAFPKIPLLSTSFPSSSLPHSFPYALLFNLSFHSHNPPNLDDYARDFSFNSIIKQRHRLFPYYLDFNSIIQSPQCSLWEINCYLYWLVREEHYSFVISLWKRAQSKGFTPSDVTLCILMNCYCYLRQMRFAFSMLGKIIKKGFQPEVSVLTTLLKALCVNNKIGEALDLLDFYDEITAKEFLLDKVIYCNLIDSLCKTGHIETAKKLLHKIGRLRAKSDYNTVIDALCENGPVSEAYDLYSQMIVLGISPDIFTYNSLIDGFSRLAVGKCQTLMQLLNEMLLKKVNPDIYTYNALLKSFGREGRVIEARAIFCVMTKQGEIPDANTYNYLMFGLCEVNDIDQLFEVFDKMFISGGMKPNALSYHILITGHSKIERMDEALALFREMFLKKVFPIIFTYYTLIEYLFKLRRDQDVCDVIEKMFENGHSFFDFIYFTLIIVYLKEEDVESEEHVESEEDYLPNDERPPRLTYSKIIDALCKQGRLLIAQKIFELLLKTSQVDIYTYNIMINAFCKVGSLDKAINLLSENGYSRDSDTYETLIHKLKNETFEEWEECFIKEKNDGKNDKEIQEIGLNQDLLK